MERNFKIPTAQCEIKKQQAWALITVGPLDKVKNKKALPSQSPPDFWGSN